MFTQKLSKLGSRVGPAKRVSPPAPSPMVRGQPRTGITQRPPARVFPKREEATPPMKRPYPSVSNALPLGGANSGVGRLRKFYGSRGLK